MNEKNEYCENDYITHGNLQSQCNPYQITNGTFHRIRTKCSTICMETQKTQNSQSNLQKEKQSWMEESGSLISGYTTKLQQTRQYDTGIKTAIQINETG